MLVIREYKENEIEEIKQLLVVEGINDLQIEDFLYIALEDDIIIGACKIEVDEENSVLKYIVIKESHRGEDLGEGLLRASLSRLENNGIVRVYFDDMNSYLLKKGFYKNEQKKLELNLSEFFTMKCKCSGEIQ